MLVQQIKRIKFFGNPLKIGHLAEKRLKMIFGLILNELHPKIVPSVLDRWRFSRFFSKKSRFCRHFDFRLQFWSFLKIKPLEECKNALSLIYWKVSKIGLLKSAILTYAAILSKKFFLDVFLF
jgi:hypothetical protein